MKLRLSAVTAFLFVSGAGALALQNIWFREFRLVFGASTPAFGAVLAIFMAGLWAGSLFWGRRTDRHSDPLRLYALLECGVGLTAAATPFLIRAVFSLYALLGGDAALGTVGGHAGRILLSLLVLGVPTFLMGGTLPSVVKSIAFEGDRSRRHVAWLYGANTLGAVLGTFLPTFFLIERMGCDRTLWLACTLIMVAGVGAWGIARRYPFRGEAGEPSAHDIPSVEPGDVPAAIILPAAAASGFAFFFLELIWYRMLSPLLGGSVYTFGLILSAALLGIGIGGMTYTFMKRSFRPTLRLLALTFALEAFFAGLPYAMGDSIAQLALWVRPVGEFSFSTLVWGWASVAAVVVLVPSVVAGFQYCVLIALLGEGQARLGRQVGDTAAWNTAGAILGSLAGGFGLLSLLSAPGSWRICVFLLSLLGMVAGIVAAHRAKRLRPSLLPLALGLLALGSVFCSEGPTAAWRQSAIGAGRAGLAESGENGFEKWRRAKRFAVAWEREGRESSVAVTNGGGLLINGKSDGSAVEDAGMQIMSPLIGALLHPHPKRALVIGLGTGCSAGWLAQVDSIESVDVVELEPAVVEAARRFAAVNRDVLSNPKVHVRIGDGREFLMTTRERYDVIFSEPSNPYRAGVSGLFTSEFYKAVASRLNPDGIFLQWLQAYEVDRRTVATVYATLGKVFPNIETWQPMVGDLLLSATRDPQVHDVPRITSRLETPPFELGTEVSWRGTGLPALYAHFIGTNGLSRELAGEPGGETNTDDRMPIEFAFARQVGRKLPFSIQDLRLLAISRHTDRPALIGGEVDWIAARDRRATFLTVEDAPLPIPPGGVSQFYQRTLAKELFRRGDPLAFETWKKQSAPPGDTFELSLVADGLAREADPKALDLIRELAKSHPAEAEIVSATLSWRRGRFEESAEHLMNAFRAYVRDPWTLHNLVENALGLARKVAEKDRSAGIRLFETLEKPFPFSLLNVQRLNVLSALAEKLDLRRLCARAIEPFGRLSPWDREALKFKARCYDATGDPRLNEAREELKRFSANEFYEAHQ
jgi:predicted membrane-bound spermidine synthase